MKEFLAPTLAMTDAIAKIFLVAAIAGYVVRKKILDDTHIKALSDATVKIFLPAFSFSVVIEQFHPYQMPDWWVLPLLGFAFPVVFMAVTALFYLPKVRENMNKFPIAALQNVGYLVLPVGQILYRSQFEKFAMYVFLLILGFNVALWTVGKMLISYQVGKTEIRLAEMITPPFVANILAMVLVFLNVQKFLPGLVMEPISILGQAAVPLGMFVLGATLGSVSLRNLPKFSDIVKLSFVKYVLLPASAVVLIIWTKLNIENQLLADVLVIEATAAPAANLIVRVKKYGGSEHLVASLMFIMYLEALVMMPLWLGIWKSLG